MMKTNYQILTRTLVASLSLTLSHKHTDTHTLTSHFFSSCKMDFFLVIPRPGDKITRHDVVKMLRYTAEATEIQVGFHSKMPRRWLFQSMFASGTYLSNMIRYWNDDGGLKSSMLNSGPHLIAHFTSPSLKVTEQLVSKSIRQYLFSHFNMQVFTLKLISHYKLAKKYVLDNDKYAINVFTRKVDRRGRLTEINDSDESIESADTNDIYLPDSETECSSSDDSNKSGDGGNNNSDNNDGGSNSDDSNKSGDDGNNNSDNNDGGSSSDDNNRDDGTDSDDCSNSSSSNDDKNRDDGTDSDTCSSDSSEITRKKMKREIGSGDNDSFSVIVISDSD